MSAEAKVSRGWAGRFFIIAAMFIAFGCWAIYDGMIGYPEQNRAYDVYTELRDTERLEEWPDIAEQEGWDVEPPRQRSTWDIRTQFIMAGVCLPIGLFALFHALRGMRQGFSSDDQGFITTAGQRVPYDAVTNIDWELWNKKGYAYVEYELNGVSQSFLIDDVKYLQANEVLAEIAEHTGQKDLKAVRMPWSKKAELKEEIDSVSDEQEETDSASPPDRDQV